MRAERRSSPVVLTPGSLDHPLGGPILLSVLWLACIAFVGVHGEFPLNDDFAYARSTLTYLQTGRFERLAWTYTPIVTNVAIGVLASKGFGFSFAVLRCTTLLLGWLGVLGTYVLGRQYGATRGHSTLAAATLAFCPVYLSLSFTFMTDVPFVALVVWSQVCMVAWLQRRRLWLLLVALGLCLLATLSRQTGLALFATLGLVAASALRKRELTWVVGSLALVGVAYGLSSLFVQASGESGHYFSLFRAITREFSLYAALANSVSASVYLGVFLLPVVLVLPAVLPPIPPGARGWHTVWIAGVVILGVAAIKRLGLGLPPGLNVIMDLGIGPRILHGSELAPRAPAAVWWAVVACGLMSIASASARAAYALCGPGLARAKALWASRAVHAPRLVAPLFALAFLLPHLLRAPLFDRYLLTILPGLMASLLARSPSPSASASPAPSPAPRRWLAHASALAALAALSTFSVLATHDYLAHHRTRWALLETLRARGVDSHAVDGGFEFLAWYNYMPWPEGKLKKATYRYWLDDDAYVLTMRPSLAGYARLDAAHHERYLPPGRETLYLLRREDTH